MDTIKDKQRLDALSESGQAPWRMVGYEPAPGVLTVRLPLTDAAQPVTRVLALGCHSDDIEIGCGATLLALTRARPDVEVTWVVLGAEGDRAMEARASAGRFLESAGAAEVVVHGFRDGFFPYVGAEVKDVFEQLKATIDPQVVFTHTRFDLHQDHRLVCELTWNTFRDHLIFEYEVPKYDGDLGTPNLFVPVTRELAEEKARSRVRGISHADRRSTGSRPRSSSGSCACGAWSAALPRATRKPSRAGSSRWRLRDVRTLRCRERGKLMRVLVTGHHGFIGSVLAPVLVRGGARRGRPRHLLLPGLRLR